MIGRGHLASAALAALAISLAGCMSESIGSGVASPTTAGSATDMPTTSPAMTPAPTDAPTLALPAGMPLPPEAIAVEAPTGSGAVAAWNVAADPPDAYDFFLRELPASGFAVDGAFPGGDAAIIRFRSPDGVAYQLDLAGHDPVRVILGPPHD